jgi:hypothetical protein
MAMFGGYRQHIYVLGLVLVLYLSHFRISGSSVDVPVRLVVDDEDVDIAGVSSTTSKSKSHRSEIINFAAESAGATVLAGSDECKGFSNILNNDKDRYAMCPCSAKRKSVTISLSEDVSQPVTLHVLISPVCVCALT